MSAEQSWKDKFLKQIDLQELAEQRWQQQLELLRRALVCSSLAAEGSDAAVDVHLKQMRDVLRQDDFTGPLAVLLPRLERALLQSESRRQERLVSVSSLLQNLLSHLRGLPLQGETRKGLSRLEKRLKKTPPHSQVLVPLLSELVSVHHSALHELGFEPPKQGLLARWLGLGSNRTPPLLSQAEAPNAPTDSAPLAVEEAAAQSTLETLEVAPVQSAEQVAEAYGSEPSHDLDMPRAELGVVNAALSSDEAAVLDAEPVYSSIAEHVQSTLLRLLEELKAPEDFVEQVQALQRRIVAGLNLYELVAVLDDLARLVLDVNGNGSQAFEGYLVKLNERLNSFHASLEDAGLGYAQSVSAARDLDQAVNEHVSDLADCISRAESLELLQQNVDSRLEAMRSTMAKYQQSVDQYEQSLGQHLQNLTLRVQKMEQEAKTFQDHLEQQRQLALLDSLTGLPNRAAWRERVQAEVARWQRHGGELVMVIMDVDLFKRVNDQFGHLAGDKVLKIIAHELRKRLRKSDFIARFGGEEFVLLLPLTPLSAAQTLLEELREGISQCPFHFKGERVVITLSAGLSMFQHGETAEAVFERADQALYRAKHLGRNQVVLADP